MLLRPPPIETNRKPKPGGRPIGRPSAKAGWREVGGQSCYFRSSWEANYARFLQLLVDDGFIKSWEHEPVTFWFEAIRRGVRSYLPDFRVVLLDGTHVWHEVKGWMDNKSRTKIKRMGIYFPGEKLVVIEKDEYAQIGDMARARIPDWETPTASPR